MRIAKRSSFFVFLLISLLSLGCAEWFLTQNISTYGGDIDFLFDLVSWIVLPITVVVFVIMLYFLIRFRKSRNEKADYLPGSHGNPGEKIAKIVLVIDGVVLLLDLVILYFTVGAWNQIEGPIVQTKPGAWSFPIASESSPGQETSLTSDVIEMQVIGRQFAWNFVYPGPDRKFLVNAGPDGIRNTLDDIDDNIYQSYAMHVPVDTKIIMHIQSPDVIHSFWVKNLRFKQDSLPGRTITKWFEIDSEKMGTVDWDIDLDMNSIRTLETQIRSLRAERIDYRHGETREKFQTTLEKFNAEWKKPQKDKKTLQTLAQEVKALQSGLNTLNERIETGLVDREFEQAQQELRNAHKRAQRGKRLFEIACAELCGNYHYLMNAWLVIHSKEGFNRWLKKQTDPAEPITQHEVKQKFVQSFPVLPGEESSEERRHDKYRDLHDEHDDDRGEESNEKRRHDEYKELHDEHDDDRHD